MHLSHPDLLFFNHETHQTYEIISQKERDPTKHPKKATTARSEILGSRASMARLLQ